MKRYKKVFCFMFCCLCLPFCLFACGSSTGGSDEDINVEEYITNVTLVYTSDGEDTYADVMTLVDDLTTAIIDGLYSEYGATSINAKFRDDVEDTHKNAIWQDSWNWAGEESYSTSGGSELWSGEALDKADYSLVLKYNLYQILRNAEVVDIGVCNLTTESEYFTMVQNGAFSDATFEGFAKEVSHTGLFYYEADEICEYILDYVIGANAIAYDKVKFVDVNGNGTFDYNENIKSLMGLSVPEYRYPTIINYDLNKSRSQKTSRNEIWDTIEFGKTVLDVEPPSSELLDEKAYDINYLTINNIANGYSIGGEIHYSGFKNYVNTVYALVYGAVGDVFEMEHLPNIKTEDVESIKVLLDYGEADDTKSNAFAIESRNYTKVILKAEQNISLTSIMIGFQLDESVSQSAEITVSAMYYHCIDASEHEHSSSCQFQKVVGILGTTVVQPGEFDIKTNDLIYMDLERSDGEGDNENLGLDFINQGVFSFDLTKFIEIEDNKLVAGESETLKGYELVYDENINDYLEISFDVHSGGIAIPFSFTIII